MADSKLEIKVGPITFSGEGDGDWLSAQLDKVLSKIPELVAAAPQESPAGGNNGAKQSGAQTTGQVSGTLAAHLKATGSTTNQVRKFLATAVWLHDTQNKSRLTTAEIPNALKSSNQSRLSNPSDALGKNVGKGFCDKDASGFFVTPEGRASLGQ